MNSFTTKIKLKDEVTRDEIWSLIEEWLTKSPHYNIDKLEKEDAPIYSTDYDGCKITYLSDELYGKKIFAARFENYEKKNIWTTDVIFTDGGDGKNIAFKLSCAANDYKKDLPPLHTPHIVKLLFEKGLCFDGGALPITKEPILLKCGDEEKIASIMSGKSKTWLPVVYVSYDDFNSSGYDVDPENLAYKLAGLAHTVVEPDKKFSFKVKAISKEFNVYNGYVGIYFPETGNKETISLKDYFNNGYLDKKKFLDAICDAVRSASLNYAREDDISWEELMTEHFRKNTAQYRTKVAEKTDELKQYMANFDNENISLKNSNEKLKDENDYLRSQILKKDNIIESYKQIKNSKSEIGINCSLKEFYPAEVSDFILNILEQLKNKFPPKMRVSEIMECILNENEKAGHGDELMKDVENALKEKSYEATCRELEKCGFTRVSENKHVKVYYKDKKYMFTVDKTGSDHKADDNLLSDIIKYLENNKKI